MQDRTPMTLRTHTSLWQVEKKLHKVYDITLPFPVTFRQIGVVVLVFPFWFVLLSLLRVPFGSPWHVVWLAPPVLAAWWAGKPIAEGKRIGELVASRVRYLFQPRHLRGTRDVRPVDQVELSSRVWRPSTRS